jgi:hypothetical protein
VNAGLSARHSRRLLTFSDIDRLESRLLAPHRQRLSSRAAHKVCPKSNHITDTAASPLQYCGPAIGHPDSSDANTLGLLQKAGGFLHCPFLTPERSASGFPRPGSPSWPGSAGRWTMRTADISDLDRSSPSFRSRSQQPLHSTGELLLPSVSS